MNRQQADHILEAYVRMRMHENDEYDEYVFDSLREVILDAMTEYKTITLTTPNRWSNWDGTPKVTCTGIDPAFTGNTKAVGA